MNKYIGYCEHIATGEGVSVWISVVRAKNKEEAWKEFKKKSSIHEYYNPNIQIIPIRKLDKVAYMDKLGSILTVYFPAKFIELLFDNNASSLYEFDFKFHFNNN